MPASPNGRRRRSRTPEGTDHQPAEAAQQEVPEADEPERPDGPTPDAESDEPPPPNEGWEPV